MPTIHDLVRALAQREGVEAAVVLGRDGLLIDARTAQDQDAEHLAAVVPALAAAADRLGNAASRGTMITSVVELERGMAVITAASSDALLLVLTNSHADMGSLLYELRSHRANIASLV